MKERNSKDILTDTYEPHMKNSDSYFMFFEHAPVGLYIEDFSEVEKHVKSKAKEKNISIKDFLEYNPKVTQSLHELVIIKEVNETAVKMFKAKSKNDLLENLTKVFTNESAAGFVKLITGLLLGEDEVVVETTNKTLTGETIHICVKYKVNSQAVDRLKNVVVSIEDISNRVKERLKLSESERIYKESQSLAKITSWYYHCAKKEIFWSDEVFDLLGVSSKKTPITLDYFLTFVHPEDRLVVSDFCEEKYLKNPYQEINYRVTDAQGKLKYLFEKRNAVIENNDIVRIIGTCQDISQKVLSEKKLNLTKKFLSNTVSNIIDGFVILDQNANYLYVNSIAEKLLNKTEGYLLGKNLWDEFPETSGDVFYDKYQEAIATKKPISFENYYAPWGRWFENRIIPSGSEVLIFFHETTQKKVSENKIKTAYNIINKSSSVAILCENSWDFPVVFASENSEKLFGYTSNELLSNEIKFYSIVHPEDLEYISRQVINILKCSSCTNIKPEKFRIITKQGEVKWIETSLDVITNSKNEITHIQGIVEDVTKRKRTEDLFFESSQRLKDQFNNTPLGSIIWDLDFKVIDWNNSAQRIFGYSKEEAFGCEARDLIVPAEIRDRVQGVWKELLAQKGGNRNINENITKSGERITCDWYNVTLKDVNGNVIGVASLVDDITERSKSKMLLEKSEKKYRDIFEKSIDAVMILKNGIFTDCNKSTLEMFGFESKDELLKSKPSDFSPELQPDGMDSVQKSISLIEESIEKGSIRFRWVHKKRNNELFPAEVSLTRIFDQKNNPVIHAVVKDISTRVKQENIEKVLYNISNAALTLDSFEKFGSYIKSELHKIIDTSNFYIALYNEEQHDFSVAFLADEKDTVTTFPAKGTLSYYVLKTNKALLFTNETHKSLIKKGEVDLVGADSKIWVGVPLKTQEKKYGVIAVQSYTNENAYNQDDLKLLEFVADQISISIQQKDAENKLKQALLKAQESDRLKSAFLANMSHEIRTPMNGIIGFSELFLDKHLSYEERKEYAKIVINSSKQLLSIVNDILDISKIEAGVVKLNYSEVNINKLLNELQAFYFPIAAEKNLGLVCKKGLENKDSTINIDKTKLHQIMTNLLSNAFKFTDIGSIEFGYSCEGEMLQFFVKDTGTGINKELHDKIFDRFIQADTDLEKQHKGTGLGLAISKKFVELFKGEIWLDSSNEGTTVYFTIPYDKAKPKAVTSVIEPKPKLEPSNKSKTILVAEDEMYNLLYINELFSKTDYRIIEATNGKEAVESVDKNPDIDLVLMDIKMPIMNGNDAMAKIKAAHPSIPVVALSAFAMESDKETALSNGFDSYLSKPIDKRKLFEVIEEFTK